MNVKTPQADKDFAVQIIRTTSARIALIREEVNEIGLAVAQGRMAASEALTHLENVAPGCASAVALSLVLGPGGTS
jgi:hypothetical protein